MRRIIIVANPAAGGARDRERLDRFVDLLRGRGGDVCLSWTTSPEPDPAVIPEAPEADVIVAAGGDGTLHQVVNALHRRGLSTPVAFLPFGTANVFRHEVRLPPADEELADLIATAEPVLYRPGLCRFLGPGRSVEERVFLLMTGIGWDARVTMAVSGRAKKLVGKAAYVGAALGLLMSPTGGAFTVLVDGREETGEGVIAAVSPWYAGRFRLVPEADRTLPGLSLAIIRRFSPSGIASLLRGALRQRPDRSGNVIYTRAEQVEVPESGIPLQMDGDPVGFSPAVLSRAPGGFRTFVGT
jgi:diacylglycerol kinase (ATP)